MLPGTLERKQRHDGLRKDNFASVDNREAMHAANRHEEMLVLAATQQQATAAVPYREQLDPSATDLFRTEEGLCGHRPVLQSVVVAEFGIPAQFACAGDRGGVDAIVILAQFGR